jgi:hypothetical protein
MMPRSEEVVMVSWFPMIGGALLVLAVFVLAARRRGYQKDGGSFMTRIACIAILLVAVAVLSVRTSVVRHAAPATVATVEASGPFLGAGTLHSEAPPPAPTKPRKSNLRPPSPPEEPKVRWEKSIEAIGAREKVEEVFWDQARVWLMHDLHLSVPPEQEFMNQTKWLQKKNECLTDGPEVNGDKTFRFRADLELTTEGWRELAEMERKGLAHERTETTARVLAILTVLLGAVAGYIRLDEWTKGYYTGRLRLAALALVVAATAVFVGV